MKQPIFIVNGSKCVLWRKEVPIVGLIDFWKKLGAWEPKNSKFSPCYAARKRSEIEEKLLLNIYRKMVSIFKNRPSWIMSDAS